MANIDGNEKESFIEIIIDAKEMSDSMIIDKEEWKRYTKIKSDCLKKIDDYITNNIKQTYRKDLKKLINDFYNAMEDYSQFNCTQYYFTGMKDCIELYSFLFFKN